MKKIITVICICCLLVCVVVLPSSAYAIIDSYNASATGIHKPVLNASLSFTIPNPYTPNDTTQYIGNTSPVINYYGSLSDITTAEVDYPITQSSETLYIRRDTRYNANSYYKTTYDAHGGAIVNYVVSRAYQSDYPMQSINFFVDNINLYRPTNNTDTLDTISLVKTSPMTNYGRIIFDIDYVEGRVGVETSDTVVTQQIDVTLGATDLSYIDDENYVYGYEIGKLIDNSIADEQRNDGTFVIKPNTAVRIRNLRFFVESGTFDNIQHNICYLDDGYYSNTFITPKETLDGGAILVRDVSLNLNGFGQMLYNAVDGFMSFQVYPGITLANILYVVMGVALLIVILKIYAGG